MSNKYMTFRETVLLIGAFLILKELTVFFINVFVVGG